MYYTREQVQQRLAAQMEHHNALVFSASGLGMVAHFAERGGADMAVIYSGAYFRLQGLPESISCMDVYDCNDLILDLGKRVKIAIREVPMAAGIIFTDASRDLNDYFDELKQIGFSAVMNYPSPGMYDERIRDDMEHSGAGLAEELAGMKKAHDKGLYVICNTWSLEDLKKQVAGDIDAVIFHLGFTRSSRNIPLDDCVETLNAAEKIVHQAKPGIPFLAHGGPIQTPEAADYLYKKTAIDGVFLGAAGDADAISDSICSVVKEFKSKPLGGNYK